MPDIKTVIIDDEPRAIEVIERYCKDLDNVSILGTFRNPLLALDFLNKQPYDLLFLDINMPKLSGMDLLDLMEYKPGIIFTTAYSDFALDSYDYNAIDYLLKPISFKRFIKALKKYEQQNNNPTHDGSEISFESNKTIYIKSGPQVHRISVKDIQYLEKDGNYLIFHTEKKRILSRQNMKDIFQILSPDEFIRIHKSYVVAKRYIEIIENTQIKIEDKFLPIGRNYRNVVNQLIN